MSEEASLRELRLEKLARLRELGADPYAVERFPYPYSAQQLLARFEDLQGEPIPFAGRIVSLRLMGKAAFAHLSDGDNRIQGYFRKDDIGDQAWEVFQLLDIGDHLGVNGKLFLTKTGEKSIHVESLTPLSKSLQALPLGKEKDGQHWYGLSDVDLRYRHRHLDLVCNPEARKSLLDRSRIVTAVRHYFDSAGFLEVETPLLQLEAGGAAARPFKTHYNAYDLEVKLRISLELYLKRIICGDVPRVYEIGRVFRNEGVSNRHNPEFTLLEWYEAFANLEDQMERVEELFRFVSARVYGTQDVVVPDSISSYLEPWGLNVRPGQSGKLYQDVLVTRVWDARNPQRVRSVKRRRIESDAEVFEFSRPVSLKIASQKSIILSIAEPLYYKHSLKSHTFFFEEHLSPGTYLFCLNFKNKPTPTRIDFSKPWHRLDLLAAIEAATGLRQADFANLETALAAARANNVEAKAKAAGGSINLAKEDNLGGFIEKLLEVFIEPNLQEPTFVVGYPIETSPLAKKDPARPGFTRRFEGYVLGREVCNAFSEINDPIDQRERFEQQIAERAKGDDEAHPMDEDYVYALEGGMPPCGGVGIGIDRMVMLLTGSEHLREVLLFPMMRPEA